MVHLISNKITVIMEKRKKKVYSHFKKNFHQFKIISCKLDTTFIWILQVFKYMVEDLNWCLLQLFGNSILNVLNVIKLFPFQSTLNLGKEKKVCKMCRSILMQQESVVLLKMFFAATLHADKRQRITPRSRDKFFSCANLFVIFCWLFFTNTEFYSKKSSHYYCLSWPTISHAFFPFELVWPLNRTLTCCLSARNSLPALNFEKQQKSVHS